MPVVDNEIKEYQSEMQEIISAPPPWLVQWGMSLFFLILMMIVGISAMIRYPDVVKTQLKVNSENAPKAVMPKISGKLVRLLVSDNQHVRQGEPLAYLESTGNHDEVLEILHQLKSIQEQIILVKPISLSILNSPKTFGLGELQGPYQNFYQSFLTYKATITEGLYLKKKTYLQNDLKNIFSQRRYLLSQKRLQEQEYELTRQEYEMHKKLFEQKVEAKMEFKREEAKFLSAQHPLEQTETALIGNVIAYSAKEKEIMELDNQIAEAKSTFLQALNTEISEFENWKSKYVLTASQAGRVVYAGVIQENQYTNVNEELFYINPQDTRFFGLVSIPQHSIAKVKTGQEVLIKLTSFPYEEYGILHGKIVSIAEVPFKDTAFISQVHFDLKNANLKKPIHLKSGMAAEAEIITQDLSLLSRLLKNVIKIIE